VPGVSRISSLWRNLTQRRRVERDLDDEVRAAFDLLVDERVRGGMPADDARRVASLELGGVEGLKEQVREARAGALVDSCLQDIRYALRLLRRNLIFSITASLSLATGIGATTTIFTVVNGLLLRAPAGVAHPDRLVDLFHAEDGNRLVEPAESNSAVLASQGSLSPGAGRRRRAIRRSQVYRPDRGRAGVDAGGPSG
jgi:hypothetical protein